MSIVPVKIFDELEDSVVEGKAKFDLDNGEVFDIEYTKNQATAPYKLKDYECSSGLIQVQNKELEFAIDVNKKTGDYRVGETQLAEIKSLIIELVQGDAPKKSKKKKF